VFENAHDGVSHQNVNGQQARLVQTGAGETVGKARSVLDKHEGGRCLDGRPRDVGNLRLEVAEQARSRLPVMQMTGTGGPDYQRIDVSGPQAMSLLRKPQPKLVVGSLKGASARSVPD
jgi:hypothetical protein